ncbi:MAG TPA: hypothetical protein VHK47_06995 [Polyangia bacterium]|nr:hypothetical protein [Polyangia bacterium]
MARVGAAVLALAGLALLNGCGSDDDDDDDNDPSNGGMCFPDADGLTGGSYTLALTVTDTGFSKTVFNTQDNSMVTFTLTNSGTKPHGFELECADVTTVYTKLPATCPKTLCFPESSKIAPIVPGESKTVTFSTPTADNLIYTFKSSEPTDSTVPELNNGQWSIM